MDDPIIWEVSNADNRIVYRGPDRVKAERIAQKWLMILLDELDHPPTPEQEANTTRFVWLYDAGKHLQKESK